VEYKVGILVVVFPSL